MAIAKLNPILTGIRGRIGRAVFYFRNGRQCVRMYVKGINPDTKAQKIVRRTFGEAVKSWQVATGDEKHKFNRKAAYLNMSGYNLYISQYMKTRITAMSSPDLKTAASGIRHSSRKKRPFTSVSAPFIRAFTQNTPCNGHSTGSRISIDAL